MSTQQKEIVVSASTAPVTRPSGTRSSDVAVSPPPVVSGAVGDLTDRARTGLRRACESPSAGERYTLAHLAALRSAAAMLAAREQPRSPRRGGPRSAWVALATVAPELGEWSQFFTFTARRRQSVERGAEVSSREADDLVRQSETFLELVESHLGLPVHASVTQSMRPLTRP